MSLVIERLIVFVDRFYRLRKITWHEELLNILAKLQLSSIVYFIDIFLFKTKIITMWEPEVSEYLLSTKGKLFVDVGSCYGQYSILLSPNYEKVIAIEPGPQNIETIIANITYSHAKNILTLPYAISNEEGYRWLTLDNHSDGFRFSKDGEKGNVLTKTSTLSSLLKGQKVDLIKVDVEGAEWQVLNGSIPIMNSVQKWVIELHNLKRKKELEQFFILYDYSVHWLDRIHLCAINKNYSPLPSNSDNSDKLTDNLP